MFGDAGNSNAVALQWKRTNSSFYDTLVDDCHVYVYGIDLTKRFSENQGDLSKVEFALYNDTDKYFVKAQRNRVLCEKELELPPQSGYRRYVSHELSRRMCENAALYLLLDASLCGVKVVLVDDKGDSVGLCDHLSDLCDPVYVVTDAKKI